MPDGGAGGGTRRGDERLPPRAAPRAVEAGDRHRRPHPRHGGNRRGHRAVPGSPHLPRPVRLEGASVPRKRVRVHRSLRRTVPDPDARGADRTARRLRALLDVGRRRPKACRRPDDPLLPHGGGAQGPGARGGTGAALLHPQGARRRRWRGRRPASSASRSTTSRRTGGSSRSCRRRGWSSRRGWTTGSGTFPPGRSRGRTSDFPREG